MSLGLIRRVLVVSPLSTLEPVHGKELFQSFPHRSFTILHGVAAKRKALALADFDFYIINHDGVEVISKILAARSDIDLVIIDEIGAYRNGQTARWKALNSVLRPEQRVWGMTGTPTPNEPTDAYSQVRLVRPGVRSEYSSFTAFKTATMNKVSMFKFAPKPDAMDRVYAIMQPAIRFSRDECLDLPECLYETRDVELTAAQRKAYTEMVKNLTTEVSGGKITALNEAIKLMRLMQIVSGVAYDVNAEHQQIDCAPRTKVLKEIVEEAGQKVIVYVPFQGNLTHLKKELDKVSTCAVVYGLTPIKERNETFHAFQNYPNPRVLIAHPGCMSHGLNLQAASTIVWWAPVNSNDIYTQANGRINRAGQKNAMTVFHLASTEIERNVYKRLELKQKLQGLLLDMIRGYESN
jgi:SNF2 family DNA or RNA helicase